MRRISLILLTSLVSLLAGSVSLKAAPIHVMDYTNKVWNVWTNGTDPGYGVTAGSPDWAQKTFDDTAWPTGVGLFGNDGTVYAPYGFTTVTPPPSVAIRFYARTHFTWSGSPVGVVLTGTNFIDDGAVIYLNGVEIYRYNMPAGPTTFGTVAVAANPAPYPEPSRIPFDIALDTLTSNPLVAGDNVIAVETASNASSSSDTVWAMSLFAGQSIAPCTDGIEPTNRAIVAGRSTTFTVVEQCAIPPATILWYRNVGAGEEQIFDPITLAPVTGASYTLSNAVPADAGIYYARLTNTKGTVDSRQAVLTITPDMTAPVFILASVVGPGLNTFRLTTDEQLCDDAGACGSQFSFQFNWQINQSDDLLVDLGVASITMINPTTYEFITSSPRDPTKQYQITVTPIFGEISDLYGNAVAPGTYAETLPQVSFQEGDANGYVGTHDTEVRQNAPDDTTQYTRDFFNVDLSDNTVGGGTAGPVDGLLRFDSIIGNSPTQIPPGSTIVEVKLVLSSSQANANGNPINLHRMLIPWVESTATWNSMVNGISADGVEANSTPDVPNYDTALTVPFVITLDSTTYPGLRDTVQAWANGTPNYGWVFLPTGTDGYRVDSSEAASVVNRPLLVVEYRPTVCSGAPVIVAQPPAAIAANELQSFSITVGVSNACDATFQWTLGGTDITGANGSTYTVSSASPANNGSYRLRVTNTGGTVTSSAAVVTVSPKTTRPHVTRVVSGADGTTITVTYNEAVSTASAQNTANYTLTPSVGVSSAVLGANHTVTLTTAARSVGTAYSLRIAGVTDVAATPNLIDPNPTIVGLTSASVVAGAEWNSTWLYNSNNLDSTAGAWKTTGYTPGADWGTGPALIGSETGAAGSPPAAPAPIATPLTPNSVAATSEELVTTYFRKSITLPALPAGAQYVVCHYTDDGFIAYLDGAEIHRFGMAPASAGAITFTNRSTGIPTGDATLNYFSFTATPGAHLLAAELHQAGVTTSDVLFGMEVRIVGGPSPTLSISRAGDGAMNLRWGADSSWQLRDATDVAGPYNAVTVPAANPLGTYTLPSGSVTNRNFWLLDYICLP